MQAHMHWPFFWPGSPSMYSGLCLHSPDAAHACVVGRRESAQTHTETDASEAKPEGTRAHGHAYGDEKERIVISGLARRDRNWFLE